jgi:hypothetical protein
MTSPAGQDAIATVAARSGVEPAFVRTFATEARDLDIDFHAPRAVVVTEILTACLGVDAPRLWDLPISSRVLLLIAVSERNAPHIELYFDCECGEQAELELTALELAEFSASRASTSLDVPDSGVRLRLPTGRDQLRWTVIAASGDESELARRVLEDLVVAGELTDALVPALDRVLADADPLVELRLDTVCPACATPLSKEIDLEAIGISRLRYQQRLVLEDVHVLASAYHWTEEHIARMPAWRREEYRALLGRSRT